MADSMDRTVALRVVTRSGLEVFRRLPKFLRRLLARGLTPNYTVGAVAVCRDAQGKVLLVRSRHHTGWSLPGGLLRRGERPVEALARELAEELDLHLDPVALAELRSHTVIEPGAQQVTFIVEIDLVEPPEADQVEVVEIGWFEPSDLPVQMVSGTSRSLALAGILPLPPA